MTGGIFCSAFIDFMAKDKILLYHTNLFYPSEYEKSDKVILNYFQ